jgi:hypothetical protein
VMRAPAEVREVVTITYEGGRPRPGPLSQPAPPPPFRLTRTRKVQRMTLRWYAAEAHTRMRPSPLARPGAWDGPIRFLD